MAKDNARMAVYGMAGIYLYIMAYNIITSLESAGSDRILMIVFSIIFILAGSALVGLSVWSMHTKAKERRMMEENSQVETKSEVVEEVQKEVEEVVEEK